MGVDYKMVHGFGFPATIDKIEKYIMKYEPEMLADYDGDIYYTMDKLEDKYEYGFVPIDPMGSGKQYLVGYFEQEYIYEAEGKLIGIPDNLGVNQLNLEWLANRFNEPLGRYCVIVAS